MPNKYTKELLEPLVLKAKSYSDVMRFLNPGKPVHGGHLAHVKSRIIFFKIDTSHFLGRAWNKGLQSKNSIDEKTFIEKYLKKNGNPIITHRLKIKLLSLGLLKNECSVCENKGEWQGKKLCLQLDHEDGNSSNNELSNLKIKCPNCHSQTETYAGRNNGRLPESVMAQS